MHSSAASSLHDLIIARLKQEDLVVEGVSPNFLVAVLAARLPEWSTKSVRDAFYASPKFPRLLKQDAVKETISRGLEHGLFAYVGKHPMARTDPFVYKKPLAGDRLDYLRGYVPHPQERCGGLPRTWLHPQTYPSKLVIRSLLWVPTPLARHQTSQAMVAVRVTIRRRQRSLVLPGPERSLRRSG